MKSWLVVALLCLFTVSCSATTRSSLARLSRSRTQAQVEAELASSERLRDRVERTEQDPSSSAPSVHSTVTSSVGPDGAEQKTIDTGDEGGSTTVVLSNQNSVGVLEDETRALLAAKEQHQKSVQEQRRKDEIAHQIRQRTEAGRKLNAKIDEEAKKTEAQSLEKELSDVRSHIAQMASQRAGQALGGEQSEKSSTSSSEQDSKSSASEALKQLRSSAAAAEAAKIAKEEEDAKYVIQAGVFVPRQNTVLAGADAIRAADSYSYAFWIKPDGKAAADSTKWSNIFAKGRNDNQRNPAVFLWPASTKLHIRSGSSADPTVGCDPETNLIADKWTHVVISHAVNNLQVFFNGESVCQNTKTDSPAFNDGNLWASSPWFEPAPVSLADFRFYPRVISQSEMGALVSAKKFK